MFDAKKFRSPIRDRGPRSLKPGAAGIGKVNIPLVWVLLPSYCFYFLEYIYETRIFEKVRKRTSHQLDTSVFLLRGIHELGWKNHT